MKDSDYLADWYETPKDRLLRRQTVPALTERVVFDLIEQAVQLVRSKSALELEALFSPDFVMHAFQFTTGEPQPMTVDRDRYFLLSGSWFSSYDTSAYSMSVEAISMLSEHEAQILVLVSDPNNLELRELYGSSVRESVCIGLYQSRPVITRVCVQLPESSNKRLQATRETRAPEA